MRLNRILTAHVLIVDAKTSEYLLSRRQHTGFRDGMLSVVGGHVEDTESPVDCAIREAKEEVGVNLNTSDLGFAYVLDRIEGDERIDFFFEVRLDKQQVNNLEPEKCSELKWVDPHQLPHDVIPYIKQAIDGHLEGSYFGVYREED